MIKEKNMCLVDNCYNDKEYKNTITYWQDKWGNEKFSAQLSDLCIFCRIKKTNAA